MFKWLAKRKDEDGVASDMARARALLPILRLRLDKEGSAAARAYGRGVTEVADALARALGLAEVEVMSAENLASDQLIAAFRDIAAAEERCREYLDSDSERARQGAANLSFGCQIFLHLYRMRLHERTAPEEQRGEARAIADTFANLARVLKQIGATPP